MTVGDLREIICGPDCRCTSDLPDDLPVRLQTTARVQWAATSATARLTSRQTWECQLDGVAATLAGDDPHLVLELGSVSPPRASDHQGPPEDDDG
jgi:hypothetical protein